MYRDNPVLVAFLDYWNRKRGDRMMPARADIDPTEIPKLLPHIMITDVIDGGARFRYRLFGTALVEGYGRDATGRYVDEMLAPERVTALHAFYQTMCKTRRPYYVRTHYPTASNFNLVSNRIVAPLSSDGTTIDKMITALTFDYRAELPRPIVMAIESADAVDVVNEVEGI